MISINLIVVVFYIIQPAFIAGFFYCSYCSTSISSKSRKKIRSIFHFITNLPDKKSPNSIFLKVMTLCNQSKREINQPLNSYF